MNVQSLLSFATFGEASDNALERAAMMAAQRGIPLLVLRHPGDDAARVPDFPQRLALRAAQLSRRHGAELRVATLGGPALLRWLRARTRQLLVVLDRETAGLPLCAGWRQAGSLLRLQDCPLLIVQRPATQAQRLVLLPYRSTQEAERLLGLAGQLALGLSRELFALPAPGLAPMAVDAEPWNEWPPPLTHSDYLSTRLNRAVRGFDTAAAALRIRNQARHSGVDLVIAPHDAPSLSERLLRRTLRDRLLAALECDLALLPAPLVARGAPQAAGRLRQAPRPIPGSPDRGLRHA
jgi:hypothetical protein